MAEKHTGSCYCGAVEIEVSGDPLDMGYCHCNECRRYSTAPVSAFTLWKPENVKITKGQQFLGKFKSSAMSDRRYCTKCGGHVMIDHPTLGLADVRAPLSRQPSRLHNAGLARHMSHVTRHYCVSPLGNRGEASSLPNSLQRFSASLPLRFSM